MMPETRFTSALRGCRASRGVMYMVGVIGLSAAVSCSSDPGDPLDPLDSSSRTEAGRDAASDRAEASRDGQAPGVDARESSSPVNADARTADATNERSSVDADAPATDGAGDGRADALEDSARESERDVGVDADVDAAGGAGGAGGSDSGGGGGAAGDGGQAGVDATPDANPDPVVVEAEASDVSENPPTVDAAPEASAPPPEASAPPPDASAPPPDASVEPPPPPVDAAVVVRPDGGPERDLAIVAHPDDDVLFMNPDMDRAIQGGAVSRTVFVTSGNVTDAWMDREAWIKNAHAVMVGVDNDWSCAQVTYSAHSAALCTLIAAPRNSLVFLRLRDGELPNLWVRTNGEPPFVTATVSTSMTTVDNAATYSRDGLLSVLRAIMADFGPDRIATLDSSLAYGSDIEHRDHVASAMFALVAAQAYGDVHSLTLYRGYTMTPEVQNLSAAEYARKASIMMAYRPFGPGDDYDIWVRREYPIPNRIVTGPVQQGSLCMAVSGAVAAGSDVALAPCTGAVTQRWDVGADGHVRGAGGLCLAIGGGSTGPIELATCANDSAQKWLWSTNGQLRGRDATCLSVNDDDNALYVGLCDRASGGYGVPAYQMWTP